MRNIQKKYSRLIIAITFLTMIIIISLAPNTPESFFLPEVQPPSSQAHPPYIPTFSDHAIDSGVFAAHVQGEEKLSGLDESLGSGACAFDYDNDGWIDLFIVGGSGQTHRFGKRQWWQNARGNHLFHNMGHAQFQDVTKSSGIPSLNAAGMGCAHADLDNDGNQDLVITTAAENVLLRNNGDGTFNDTTLDSGLHGKEWSTSVAIADYDSDGLPDIYIVNYLNFDKTARLKEIDAGNMTYPTPLFQAKLFDGTANQLFHNLGNLKFIEQAEQAGVDDQGGRGLSAVWIDANHDQQPDLIIANDKGTPSRLFINNGEGHFSPQGDQFGMTSTTGLHSLALGDIDGDGSTDIVAGTPNGQLLKIFLHPQSLNPQTGQNAFYEQARELSLSDSQHASFSTWAVGIHDFNLDGTLDIMAVNGLLYPDSDAPRIAVGQQKNIWLNTGLRLIDVTQKAGKALADNIAARGAAFGDFDNDGDIDALIVHNNNPTQLLINQTSDQHWLGIQLQGTSSNHDAIGATVKLSTPSGFQYREVSAGSGFLSDHDRRLQFGLGQDEKIIRLDVTWPDGSKNSYQNLASNRYYALKQGADKTDELIAITTPPEAKPKLQLTFGKGNPEFRIQYLDWLIAAGAHHDAIQTADILANDLNLSVRIQTVELLQKLPFDIKITRILAVALDDSNAQVRLAAVRTLKTFENENTIYWLLRALHDEDKTVRSATAKIFEHFFQEEEAMINKKQLAIPHLVSLLKDTSPRVRATAARALGEAESYRGVMPLIQLATDEDHSVRIQSIRSLGLLREMRALPTLESIAISSEHSPLAKAHAFIALKRLGSAEAQKFIESKLISNHSNSSVTATLFASLLTEEDGRVFEQSFFLKNILSWLKREPINPETPNNESLLTVISSLEGISEKGVTDALKPFTNSANIEVRKYAYQIMFGASGNSSSALINRALSDSSPEIQKVALKAAIKQQLRPTSATLLRLIHNNLTTELAGQLLADQLTPGLESKLVELASNHENNLELRLNSLSALAKHQTAATNWAIQNIAFDTSENLRIRKQALSSFAFKTPRNSDLIKLTHLRHDPLNRDAFGILAAQNNKYAIDTLWKTLLNTHEQEVDRIFAAKTLFPIAPQRTIAILQGNHQ